MVNIHEYLSGISDSGNSIMAMLAAPKRKIGDAIELKNMGADQLIEVRQKLVGSPLINQGGKAIKDVVNPPAALIDYPINFFSELPNP